VRISGRLDGRISLKFQRASASLSWPLSTSLCTYAFAHEVTARS
jgi:hypothetical protein